MNFPADMTRISDPESEEYAWRPRLYRREDGYWCLKSGPSEVEQKEHVIPWHEEGTPAFWFWVGRIWHDLWGWNGDSGDFQDLVIITVKEGGTK